MWVPVTLSDGWSPPSLANTRDVLSQWHVALYFVSLCKMLSGVISCQGMFCLVACLFYQHECVGQLQPHLIWWRLRKQSPSAVSKFVRPAAAQYWCSQWSAWSSALVVSNYVCGRAVLALPQSTTLFGGD
jgi:hypothetical protein